MGTASAPDPSLIERAQLGDRRAFDAVQSAFSAEVYGYVRVRVGDDHDADDIAQETWLELWQRIPGYDPDRGPFVAFAKYWAGIRLLRHWHAMAARGRVEILYSELASRFPDMHGSMEIGDLVERLAPAARTSPDPGTSADEYEQMLRATMDGPSPPHELIVFGFCKLLGWKPSRLVSEHSDTQLDALLASLEASYIHQSELPALLVRPCFTRLRKTMSRRFGEIVEERRSLETWRRLRERTVGETTLRDYYTGRPETNVSHWWLAVRRRIRTNLAMGQLGPLEARAR